MEQPLSVGGGQRLGRLEGHRVAVAAQHARPGRGAEQLDGAGAVDIALADERRRVGLAAGRRGADGAGTIGRPPQAISGRRSAGTRITTTFAVQTVLAS